MMVPKTMTDLLQRFCKAGYPAWAAGPCVRDVLLNRTPAAWEVLTEADTPAVCALFPAGTRLGSAVQMAADEKNQTVTIWTKTSPDRFCAGQPFTCDAMAMRVDGQVIDLVGGQADLAAQRVQTVGTPREVFSQNPMAILQAIRTCAELDFTLAEAVYKGAKHGAKPLRTENREAILEEFQRILTASHAGLGLSLLGQTDCLPALIGTKKARIMRRWEIKSFHNLCRQIDTLPSDPITRLSMFYLCFEGPDMMSAAEYLPLPQPLMAVLQDAERYLPFVSMANRKEKLKDVIAACGLERYQVLHELTRAQSAVFQTTDPRIAKREEMLAEILAQKEPIFLQELALGEEELIEAGLTEESGSPRLLALLLEYVHRQPHANHKQALLEEAARCANSRWMVLTRKKRWKQPGPAS